MRALVTGVAGFIGSHLCDRLLADGHDVIGIDNLTPYYDPAVKQANLAGVLDHERFTLCRQDLNDADLEALLEGVDVVWHQAGQAGVRTSWEQFDTCVANNVLATHALLDAATRVGVRRLVYASSSSIYGDAAAYPTTEGTPPRPMSPYAVTKLAAEHLCTAYARNHGLPTVSLRYFTVFGPRQRPEMAMHRLVESALDGRHFPLFGDGSQVRDFTYVGDIVEGNVRAGLIPDIQPGTVVNLSGGESVDLNRVIATIEDLTGRPIELDRHGVQAGDVQRTGGSSARAAELLDWAPRVDLASGLAHQVDWHRSRR